MNLLPLRQPQNLWLLVALLLCCLYTICASFFALMPTDGEYHKILLGKTHYAGFGAVAVCLLSYFVAPRFFRRGLGFTLLLAFVNLISFLPISFSIGITLGDFSIGVTPFGLLILALFYFLNRPAANAFIRTYLLPPPTSERAAQQRRDAIDQFKQTFARQSDASLQQLVGDQKLVADAIAAAQELLAERRAAPPATR